MLLASSLGVLRRRDGPVASVSSIAALLLRRVAVADLAPDRLGECARHRPHGRAPRWPPRGPAPSRARGVIRPRRAPTPQASAVADRALARTDGPPLTRAQEPLHRSAKIAAPGALDRRPRQPAPDRSRTQRRGRLGEPAAAHKKRPGLRAARERGDAKLVDPLLNLRRPRYGASHGVGPPSSSCQDLREPTPCPRRARLFTAVGRRDLCKGLVIASHEPFSDGSLSAGPVCKRGSERSGRIALVTVSCSAAVRAPHAGRGSAELEARPIPWMVLLRPALGAGRAEEARPGSYRTPRSASAPDFSSNVRPARCQHARSG